jgi:SAM-dependent methyltransferase
MCDMSKGSSLSVDNEITTVRQAYLERLASCCEAAYDKMADEYYIPERHPTCANFDSIQEAVLPELRPLVQGNDGYWLEVGCGRGRLDYLAAPKQVILSDISEAMLSLARQRTGGRLSCRVINAFQLPFKNSSLQGVAAFLADPYNHSAFLSQVHRVLRPGGIVLLTLPNNEWARAVRTALGQSASEAHFIHRHQATIHVPSLTHSIDQQCELFRLCGLQVVSAYSMTLAKCPTAEPSHHVNLAAQILGCDPHDVPLVDFYVASK